MRLPDRLRTQLLRGPERRSVLRFALYTDPPSGDADEARSKPEGVGRSIDHEQGLCGEVAPVEQDELAAARR